MYFEYFVERGGARFNELKKGVFRLRRQNRNTSGVNDSDLFTDVKPNERFNPKASYILSDGKNTLHLEFNAKGQVKGASSYSTNRVEHMIGSIGKQVNVPTKSV